MASRARCFRPILPIHATASVVASIASLLAVAPMAGAATLALQDDGALRVGGTAGADAITLVRIDDTTLRVLDATGPTAIDPVGTGCVLDVDGSAHCSVTASTAVSVALGDGSDRFDASAAGALAMTVDGGPGADHMRVGSAGRTTVVDTTSTDTVDLAHADQGIAVRWSGTDARLLARCDGCATPWQVLLPPRPGRITLGAFADEVDLRTWRGLGRTSWLLGADRDRWLGSPTRRGVVNAGDGWDTMISYAAADVLRGGPGFDKLVDFGGAGDVLQGGVETDALSSMDGRRDTLDGQGGRDVCLTIGMTSRQCDTGPIRSMETTLYHPLTAPLRVLRTLGIVL